MYPFLFDSCIMCKYHPRQEPSSPPNSPSVQPASCVAPITPDPAASTQVVKKDGFVLIYNGRVAAEGAPEALAAVAESMGMKVEYFSSAQELEWLLANASICMIGGTEDDLNPLIQEFTPQILKELEDWIFAGGGFLGICGGGYIGSIGWEENDGFVEMLGLAPVLSEEYIEDPNPRIITVDWEEERRTVYFANGPAFIAENPTDIEVIAYYYDGRIAVLKSNFGKGHVILSGPHPEADVTWLYDDPEPLNAEQWKATDDLIKGLFQKLR